MATCCNLLPHVWQLLKPVISASSHSEPGWHARAVPGTSHGSPSSLAPPIQDRFTMTQCACTPGPSSSVRRLLVCGFDANRVPAHSSPHSARAAQCELVCSSNPSRIHGLRMRFAVGARMLLHTVLGPCPQRHPAMRCMTRRDLRTGGVRQDQATSGLTPSGGAA